MTWFMPFLKSHFQEENQYICCIDFALLIPVPMFANGLASTVCTD